MSWLYEKRTIKSEKNGTIKVTRVLSHWEIMVDGFFETGNYVTNLWRKALKRLPADFRPKKVLLLGLGGGGLIKILQNKFPKINIIAIEWDPAMINLFKEIYPPERRKNVEIINGEALETLKKLNGSFDLILVDLFKGKAAAKTEYEDAFFENIARLLDKNAFLINNVFREKDIDLVTTKFLKKFGSWKFRYNNVSMFGQKIPADYTSHHSSKGYLEREMSGTRYQLQQAGESYGTLWHFGPLWFEKYYGDKEPKIDREGPLRLIIWEQLNRNDVPEGWKRSKLKINQNRTGFSELKENYYIEWSSNAQRNRSKWLKNSEWEIYEPTPEEYLEAYKKTRKEKTLKYLFSKILRAKIKTQGDRVKIFGARAKGGGLQAGFVCVDVPEIKQSFHLMSFHLPEALEAQAGTGLIDAWFQHGLKSGFKYLDFCLFWAPGEPKDWRGFSAFKAQFGTRFINYPKPLIRWSGRPFFGKI